MRIGRAIRLGLGSVLLILVGAIILLLTVDLGRFKSLLVGFGGDYLQRQITIDGPLSIEVGRKVQVTVSDLSVASEAWTKVPDLIRVEEASLTLDTVALLRGIALFDRVAARGIRAHLAIDASGRDNWTFAGLAGDDDEAPTPVALREVEIADVILDFLSPDLPPLGVAASRLGLAESTDASLGFEVVGSVNETPFSVFGTTGTVDNLIDGRNVPFRIDGGIGDISLTSSGAIDDLYDPVRPEVELLLEGPNAEYLTSILGIDPVTTGPFRFRATGRDENETLVIAIGGVYGEFKLDLNGRVAALQSLDAVELNLHAEGPSIDAIGRLAGRSGFPEVPFSVDAELSLNGSVLEVERLLFDLGAATLEASAYLPNFPGADGATANLVAGGPQFGDFNRLLGVPGQLTGPFDAVVSLDRVAAGSALDARLASEALQVTATGTLVDDPSLIGSSVDVVVGGDAAILAAALGAQGVPPEPFGIRAGLRVGDETIDIDNGAVTLGRETVDISGRIGRDPLSTATRLKVATTIDDLSQTAASFGVAPETLPEGGLTVTAELGRSESGYLIDSLVARLAAVEAQLNGSIGDSLTLSDVALNVVVTGRDLPRLLKLDAAYLSNEPFRVTGRVGFANENTLDVPDLEIRYGQADARIFLSVAVDDPVAAGEARVQAEGPSLAGLVPGAAEFLLEDSAFSVTGGGRWKDGSLWLTNTLFQMGEARLEAAGELHAPPEIAGTALTLKAALPSLQLLELAVRQSLPDEPVNLTAEVLADGDVLRLSEFSLALGPSDLAGTAAYRPASEPGRVPELTAELTSRLADLRPLQAFLAGASEPPAAEPDTGDVRVIPDSPLPLQALRSINGNVHLTAGRILLEHAEIRDFLLQASLADGALTIRPLELAGEAGGKLAGALRLIPAASGADLNLELDGTSLTIGLPATTEDARQLLPRYELNTRLAAAGATLRELAASSRGYIRLVGGEGSLELGALGLFTQDFAREVLDSVNPFAQKERYSKIQCLAVLLTVDEGIIEGKPAIVLQTDKLNVIGVGRVDLSSEKLNARFETQARKGIGIGVGDLVSPLTEIGGTLGSPRLQLNTAGTIVEGGAAVATVGVSFLAKKFAQRWLTSKNPCQTAIADADKDLAEGRVPLSGPRP